MRSNSFVKRTIPCLAVVLAVTMHTAPAQAGFLDAMFSLAGQVFKKTTGGKASTAPTQTATTTSSTASTTTNTPAAPTIPTAATVTAAPGVAAEAVTTPIEKEVVAEKAPFSIEADFIQKAVLQTQDNAKKAFTSNSLRKVSRAEAIRVEKVFTDTHTEIIPEYTDTGLTFRLRYDEVALKNPQQIVKEIAVITMLTSTSSNFGYASSFFGGNLETTTFVEVESPHAMAELISNVREGSPTAKARWIKIQTLLLKNMELKSQILQDLQLSSDVMQEIRQDLGAQLPAIEETARQYARKQQKALDKWKSETGTLDKLEAMQDKLDDLILKNDRKGVKQLLEAYLPWTVMEPVEANTWKIWLEAIEHPDQKNTTVAFRGLKYDTDKIQRRQTTQGEIYGFMSTVLTKNQGSYTRRLRSLVTNREKNGDIGLKAKNSDILSVKVTDQMTAHAKDPVASSFISFTYDPSVARRFMGENQTKQVKGENISVPYGGILVVKMDSRRMIPNIPSMYSTEIELLAPLIVFPDEVVAYKEGSFDHTYTYEMFIKEVSGKTGINFTSWTSAQDTNEVSLKERYNREGHAFFKQMTDVGFAAKSCSKVF